MFASPIFSAEKERENLHSSSASWNQSLVLDDIIIL